MVPEERSEEAAVSASELVDHSSSVVAPEAAESAEGSIAAPAGFNWADASEEAPVPTAEAVDPSGFEEAAAAEETPCAESGEAAFGASKDSPESEAPFDALDLLRPIEPKEEEDVPTEDILEELARPDEVLEPALEPEASVEDQPETELLASEIETNNSAAVNTETIEESLAALDLEETKEEPDFEADQEPVVEASEPVAEASEPPAAEAASSSVFAPVFVQHFDNFVDDGEVPPPPTSPFLAAEGAASGAPTEGFELLGLAILHPAHLNLRGRGAIKQAKPNKPRN